MWRGRKWPGKSTWHWWGVTEVISGDKSEPPRWDPAGEKWPINSELTWIATEIIYRRVPPMNGGFCDKWHLSIGNLKLWYDSLVHKIFEIFVFILYNFLSDIFYRNRIFEEKCLVGNISMRKENKIIVF